ncbi:MAG: DUF3857 domain-containing protein [Ginsengibacter sp.]
MKSIFFLLAIIFNFSGWAAEGTYSVLNIPKELLKNANIIKRYEEIKFQIISLERSKGYKKIALTILNENADRYSALYEFYNRQHTISSIEGTLFNADGKKIKSLKKSDIIDQSAISDFSLYEDSRIKYHSFNYKLYPFTVEYIIETEFDGSLAIPDWSPRPNEFYAVESSSIQITVPEKIDLRYKSFNLPTPVKKSTAEGKNIYTAELKNLPAIINEPYQPYLHQISPKIFFAPNDFKYGGWQGNMSSWQSFGKFQNSLNAGRDILPQNIKQEVHRIVDGVTDVKKKIALLYKYMQDNTRYISIQLGIGGFQPFEASYVAEKKYGDCKALSNYMYSLLKEAGIRSCYTIAGAGGDREDKFTLPDFANDYFNHVILAVPLQKDTMWLECTSQTLPAGYLSYFTQNRYVLVVDENGGALVKTPRYGCKENVQARKINASLDEEGNVKIQSNTIYTAMEQDKLEQRINHLSKEKMLEYLKKNIDLPNYDVLKFSYQQEKTSLPLVNEEMELSANNYASVSGKRIFISPDLLNKSNLKLLPDTARKFDIALDDEYTNIDTVIITIPANYKAESVPREEAIITKFGIYNVTIKVLENKIFYYRKLEKYNGDFPAKDFAELVNFTDQVYKSDRSKVVLVRREE